MKLVPLTQGRYALVDDEDYERVSQFKWSLSAKTSDSHVYAQRSLKRKDGKRPHIKMHIFIMGTMEGMVIDHINGNTLDNRRSNLRFVTHIQNVWNQGSRKTNTSGVKGVSYIRKTGKWLSQISFKGQRIRIGAYETKEEAHLAYCEALKRLHGEFARKA